MKRNGYTVLKRKSAWVHWSKKTFETVIENEPKEYPCIVDSTPMGTSYVYPSMVLSMAYALRMKINVEN